MQIKEIPISKLKPAAYNPRIDLKPGDPDYEKLKRSIEEFGHVYPIIWNQRSGNIVGGHQTYKVLKELKKKKVKVSVVDLDSNAEAALNIALNKISGDWDYPKLKDLIAEIDTGSFDIQLTGFDNFEIEEIFGISGTGIEDLQEIEDPEASPNFIIKCDDEFQVKDIAELLGVSGKRISYSDFKAKYANGDH